MGEILGFHPAAPGSIPGIVFYLFFQVLMVYWGRYLAFTLETRVQFPAQYFLFFSTFTLFCPFLEILKGQKRGAYTTIYQWDQVQSTRILLYFYQN